MYITVMFYFSFKLFINYLSRLNDPVREWFSITTLLLKIMLILAPEMHLEALYNKKITGTKKVNKTKINITLVTHNKIKSKGN